jgi:hypothetical protein
VYCVSTTASLCPNITDPFDVETLVKMKPSLTNRSLKETQVINAKKTELIRSVSVIPSNSQTQSCLRNSLQRLLCICGSLQCRDVKYHVPGQTCQCYYEEAHALIYWNLCSALVERKFENRDLIDNVEEIFAEVVSRIDLLSFHIL